MKLLDSADLDPTEITLGEDHAGHLDEERIDRLAATLLAGGVLPPVVVDEDRKLVAGRNRFEAYGRAGMPVRADIIAFDDHLEAQELAIRENLDRKRLTPEQEKEAIRALYKLEELRDATPPHGAEAASQPRSKAEKMRAVAEKAGRSERKVERSLDPGPTPRPRAAPPAEPIVPKPPKPVPVEVLINEFADKLADLAREGDALLPKALAEPGQATGATWRGSLRNSIGQLSKECACLRTCADDIRKARAALANNDFMAGKAAREKKARNAIPGVSDPPKVGLKAPKRIRVEDPAGKLLVEGEEAPPLPSEEEIKRSWDEGAATFGPDGETEDEGAF